MILNLPPLGPSPARGQGSKNIDGTNNFKIKVTSLRSVENVTRFINNAPVKLQGHKKLQYLLWIKNLRTIPSKTNKFRSHQIISNLQTNLGK